MTARPHVVIIGAGFGGLYAARALKRANADVTVVDRTNHHLFQPLLYQVALATLAPTDITAPIRWLLRRQRNTTVLMAEASEIRPAERTVVLDGGSRKLSYDYLILAPGARHSYFGHDEWERIAPGLKSIDDATDIRCRFLTAFEEAEMSTDAARIRALMTFVVIGGGPTGVELAGIIPDLTRHAMKGDFRNIDTTKSRVVLLEGGPRVLPAFPESLSSAAQRDLERLGVEVRTGALVTRVDEGGVYIGQEHIPAGTVLWAAGNTAAPVTRSFGDQLDRAGRVRVNADLTLPGHPEVQVIGDAAAVPMTPETTVPGVAPAAMQQGRHAGRNVIRALRGQPPLPFRYLDKGNLATIGRHRAVADFAAIGLRVRGILAWWLWLFIHILYLAGFRNRLSVLVQWSYAYFTYRRGARLITAAQRATETGTRS